jgi:DNA-directed RNA polymerase specialized sigma24 family protein
VPGRGAGGGAGDAPAPRGRRCRFATGWADGHDHAAHRREAQAEEARLPASIDADQVAGNDPGLADVEVQDLLARLPDAVRRVVERKLEGHTLREIAKADRVPQARIQRLWQTAQLLLARALGVEESKSRRVEERGAATDSRES